MGRYFIVLAIGVISIIATTTSQAVEKGDVAYICTASGDLCKVYILAKADSDVKIEFMKSCQASWIRSFEKGDVEWVPVTTVTKKRDDKRCK